LKILVELNSKPYFFSFYLIENILFVKEFLFTLLYGRFWVANWAIRVFRLGSSSSVKISETNFTFLLSNFYLSMTVLFNGIPLFISFGSSMIKKSWSEESPLGQVWRIGQKSTLSFQIKISGEESTWFLLPLLKFSGQRNLMSLSLSMSIVFSRPEALILESIYITKWLYIKRLSSINYSICCIFLISVTVLTRWCNSTWTFMFRLIREES